MGTDFKNCLHCPVLWVSFFVKIHLLSSFFGISRFMGMIFRKFSRFKCKLFRNFFGCMGST